MSRYIDADKFKNHIENCICEVQNTNGNSEDFKIVLRALANQPIANVKEVVHGEWIDIDGNDEHYKCSICNKTINGNGIPYYFNFCHKCGADMRGDK